MQGWNEYKVIEEEIKIHERRDGRLGYERLELKWR